MKALIRIACASWLLASGWTSTVWAQDSAPEPLPPPTERQPASSANVPSSPLPMLAPAFGPQPVPWYYDLDACKQCCAHPAWLMPIELYIRNGVHLVTGGGTFGERLQHGYILEVGAKNWCYDEGKTAAWVAELGIDYIYNNANKGEPIVADFRNVTLRDISRTYLRIVGGREWYWDDFDGECKRYMIGIDGGGRVGHAHAKFNDAAHNTDFTKSLLFGGYAGCMFPCCGKELIIQGRIEWEHDWLRIADADNTIEGLNLLLTIGCRF